MKFGVVNKSTTVNRFVLHTLHRNITHLAIITRKTNIKLGVLKGGGGRNWKGAIFLHLGNLINLSEQQLIDCNMQCWGCDGCSGATKAMEFLIFTNESIFESDYPYESGTTGAAKRMKNYKKNWRSQMR